MVIEVTCECGRAIEAGEEDAARGKVSCPACAKEVRIPPPGGGGGAVGSTDGAIDPLAETSPDLSEATAAAGEATAPVARRRERAPDDRCPLCGRRCRAGDVICEGCGTNLETGQPPPVKRFAGRRYDSRYVIFGAMAVGLVVAGFAVRALVRSGADDRALARAREALRAGRIAEAEEGFREAIACNEKNGVAWAGLAETLVRTSRAQEAADAAATALALDQRAGPHARAILGRARLDQGRLEEALELLAAAFKEKPDIPSVRHWIAHCFYGLRNAKDAITAYEEALAADPTSSEAPVSRLRLGTLYLLKQRTAEAEKQLAEAARTGAPAADTHGAFGDLYAQKGMAAEAQKAYLESLAANPHQPDVRFRLARLRWRGGDRAGALAEISGAKSLVGAPSDLFRLEGQIRAEMNELDAAAAAYREAIARNPKDAEAWLRLAQLEAARGEVARARQAIGEALAIDAAYGSALVELGALARKQKDWKTAADALRRAVAADALDAGLRCDYARALEEAGNHAEAFNEYREAVRLDPGAEAPRRRLAEIHLAAGRTKEAGQEYEELIKLRPKDLDLKLALARVRDAERRWDAVIQLTEAVLQKDPKNGEAKALQDKARYEKFREGG